MDDGIIVSSDDDDNVSNSSDDTVMYGDISLRTAENHDLEVADCSRIAQLKSALMKREAAFSKHVKELQHHAPFGATDYEHALTIITQQFAKLRRQQLASREAQLHILSEMHERERNDMVQGLKLNKKNVKRQVNEVKDSMAALFTNN